MVLETKIQVLGVPVANGVSFLLGLQLTEEKTICVCSAVYVCVCVFLCVTICICTLVWLWFDITDISNSNTSPYGSL